MASNVLLRWCLLMLLLLEIHQTFVSSSDRDSDPFDQARRLRDALKRFTKRLGGKRGECYGQLNEEATNWIIGIDKELEIWFQGTSEADWNYATNLTAENGAKLETSMTKLANWTSVQIEKAKYYLQNSDKICNETTLRLLRLLTFYSNVPIPKSQTTRVEIVRLVNQMEEIYGTTTITRNGTEYSLSPDLEEVMYSSRDPGELLWAWRSWHDTVGPKLKQPYTDLVEKMNEAARDNDFPDMGVYWQLVDYDEDDIETMMDGLYKKILPLYAQLHAYVRKRLDNYYGGIGRSGSIPAHLLGNMWAQTWDGIEDILLPFPNASSNYDVTQSMKEQGYTPLRMFRVAEEFFVSLGLPPMTDDFWNKSVIVRPADNTPMQCHASAHDFYSQTDFRIKMCTQVTDSDLRTVHHEMGHIEYFMLYRHQPTIFRTGANAAFHEAIGDTIALSVMTDKHLASIGLIPSSSTESYEQEINFLLRMALEKVAFLPFGYIIDKWRYMVFRGDVSPDEYTSSWWKLRKDFGGISPPVPRSSDDFDPGAKYHVPANVPYSRYFFSFIAQFQFQSTLCRLAKHEGPLHTCDIYRSKEAGERLRSVLSLGASKPWSEALKIFTGHKDFRVDDIFLYFKPLYDWLKKENEGEQIGW